MKAFNDEQPGDFVELDIRVGEVTRHMIQRMFISADEHKAMLQQALKNAISNANIGKAMELEAQTCINDAVRGYFSFGEGREIIVKAVGEALSKTIPGLFK